MTLRSASCIFFVKLISLNLWKSLLIHLKIFHRILLLTRHRREICCLVFLSMVADSRHREKNFQNREKTFIIEKKMFEYRKIFQSQKKIMKLRKKKLKSRKIFHRIVKTISKSRKMFKNREIFCYKSREKTLNSIISNSSYVPS